MDTVADRKRTKGQTTIYKTYTLNIAEVLFLLKSLNLNMVEVRQHDNDRFTFDDDYDDACFVINKDTEL